MIQRIQTIYLVLAAACAFGLFGLPFATSTKSTEVTSLFADGIYNINDHAALLALFCVAGALVLISIFLFNNRKQQLLMGRFAIIADVIGIILVLVFLYQDGAETGATEVQEQLGVGLPILFIIFALLAQKGISKDEKLVRSADRLR
jgi:peptidoglycan/LPS O-acetylase OafA/YrhL